MLPSSNEPQETHHGHQEDKNKQLAIDFFSKGINDQNFDVIARILSPLYTYNGNASSVDRKSVV